MGLFDKFKNGLFKTAQQLTGNLQGVPVKGNDQNYPSKLIERVRRTVLVRADVGAATAVSIVESGRKLLKMKRLWMADVILANHLRKALLERLLKVHISSTVFRNLPSFFNWWG